MSGNVQTAALEQEAIAIAQQLFHRTPSRLHKYHSGRHYCVAIQFDDDTADRVIKAHQWLPMGNRGREVPVPRDERAWTSSARDRIHTQGLRRAIGAVLGDAQVLRSYAERY